MNAADLFDGNTLEAVEAALHPFRSQIVDAEVVRCGLAMARQKRIAAANARIQRGFVEGIGEVVASIDADVYHRFGLIYGYETVNSPDFLKSLLRDNPEMRVQTKSRKVGIYLPSHYRAEVDTSPAPLVSDKSLAGTIRAGNCAAPCRQSPAGQPALPLAKGACV